LNAILDRMVANQREMIREDDSGESLADPPEAEENRPQPTATPARPDQPRQSASKPAAAPPGPTEAAQQKPDPPADGNDQNSRWSLDKLKKDIVANSTSSE
jgi:hypothetical protein